MGSEPIATTRSLMLNKNAFVVKLTPMPANGPSNNEPSNDHQDASSLSSAPSESALRVGLGDTNPPELDSRQSSVASATESISTTDSVGNTTPPSATGGYVQVKRASIVGKQSRTQQRTPNLRVTISSSPNPSAPHTTIRIRRSKRNSPSTWRRKNDSEAERKLVGVNSSQVKPKRVKLKVAVKATPRKRALKKKPSRANQRASPRPSPRSSPSNQPRTPRGRARLPLRSPVRNPLRSPSCSPMSPVGTPRGGGSLGNEFVLTHPTNRFNKQFWLREDIALPPVVVVEDLKVETDGESSDEEELTDEQYYMHHFAAYEAERAILRDLLSQKRDKKRSKTGASSPTDDNTPAQPKTGGAQRRSAAVVEADVKADLTGLCNTTRFNYQHESRTISRSQFEQPEEYIRFHDDPLTTPVAPQCTLEYPVANASKVEVKAKECSISPRKSAVKRRRKQAIGPRKKPKKALPVSVSASASEAERVKLLQLRYAALQRQLALVRAQQKT